MGLRLFVHAIRLVLDNLAVAFRVSAVPYIVPALLALGLLASVEPGTPPNMIAVAVLLVVVFVGGLVVAVAWHRFILLDERPTGWLPEFNSRRILVYLGYSLLLALMFVVVSTAVVTVLAALAAVLVPEPWPIVSLVPAVSMFLILAVGYRLALVLPASSVDGKLRLGEAWAATRGATGTIVVLAFLSAGASLILGLPSLVLAEAMRPLWVLWEVTIGWLSLMVGVSILTTLYGHYVEGRPVGGWRREPYPLQ